MTQAATSDAESSGYRLHIIGGPGSGKTRLSHELSQALGVPAFELDEIAGAGSPPDFLPHNRLSDRRQRVEAIAREHNWITEGAFLWWTESLLQAATVIIWLEPPRRRAIVRVWRRYLRERLYDVRYRPRSLRHPHLRPSVSFSRWVWQYYDPRRAVVAPPGSDPDELSMVATRKALGPYSSKVLKFASYPNVVLLVAAINACMGVVNVPIN